MAEFVIRNGRGRYVGWDHMIPITNRFPKFVPIGEAIVFPTPHHAHCFRNDYVVHHVTEIMPLEDALMDEML